MVRSGIRHGSPAAQGIVSLSTARCAVGVRRSFSQEEQYLVFSLRASGEGARFYTDVEAGMRLEYGIYRLVWGLKPTSGGTRPVQRFTLVGRL